MFVNNSGVCMLEEESKGNEMLDEKEYVNLVTGKIQRLIKGDMKRFILKDKVTLTRGSYVKIVDMLKDFSPYEIPIFPNHYIEGYKLDNDNVSIYIKIDLQYNGMDNVTINKVVGTCFR